MLTRTAWVLALLALALLPCRAHAHAVLLEAHPSDGQRLETPPPEITFLFNEPVRPVSVRLLDRTGAEIAGVSVESRDETLVVRVPTSLPKGTYLLSYRIISIDAHPIGATLRFGIGMDPISDGTAIPDNEAIDWAGVVARWLVYLTVLGSVGSTLFVLLVRPPPPVASRCRQLATILAWAGCAAVVIRFGVAGLDIGGLPIQAIAGAQPWQAAAGTTLAPASCLALIGLMVLVFAKHLPAWAGIIGSIAIATAFALTGHAAAAAPHWLARPALGLHMLCAAYWLGSLLPLLWSLRLGRDQAFLVLHRFSNVALVVVSALVAAGMALSWVQLGGRLSSLWETDYGQRLAFKLVLVMALLLLGLANRTFLAPAIRRGQPGAARRFTTTLTVDLLLGALVLAVTASFPLSAPPRALQLATSEVAKERRAFTATSQGRTAVIAFIPEGAGTYRLEAKVTEPNGKPMTAREATFRWSLPKAGIEPTRAPAQSAAGGTYTATRISLPLPGRWEVRLDLLVDDFTRLIFKGDLAIDRIPAPLGADHQEHEHTMH
jgi:copper transport protein